MGGDPGTCSRRTQDSPSDVRLSRGKGICGERQAGPEVGLISNESLQLLHQARVDTLNPTKLAQVVDETVNGSVTRTYAYGLQRISENQLAGNTWTPSFYGYDGHGNVRFLMNTAGAVTDTYQYDAFGMPIASTGTTANNFRYSGEWSDSSIGLYHLRARHYNQATGRFWTRDPAEYKACCGSCSPLGFNSYIYGEDDPINRVDPLGKEALAIYAFTLSKSQVYAIAGLTALATVISLNLSCDAQFVKCIATRLNDLPGSVYGSGRCLWCWEACIRLGYWPSRAPGIRGSVRCDYWNY
jgi:RHS repeat-associated protein